MDISVVVPVYGCRAAEFMESVRRNLQRSWRLLRKATLIVLDEYDTMHETETVNGDYGFGAVKFAAGNRDIKTVYHIPYMKQVAVVSIFGILLLSGYSLFLYKWNNKKK